MSAWPNWILYHCLYQFQGWAGNSSMGCANYKPHGIREGKLYFEHTERTRTDEVS